MLDTRKTAAPVPTPPGGLTSEVSPVTAYETSDLVCFAHLRWDFVFQRPNHLMARFARHRRVYYVEEPLFGPHHVHARVSPRQDGLRVVTPHLPGTLARAEAQESLGLLLEELFDGQNVKNATFWYYTPMALAFSRHLKPACVVYDCMDEFAAFKFAPPELALLEEDLLSRADVVFTGGHSLFEAKRHRHPNIHPFPSGIDKAHFARSRAAMGAEPEDQAQLPGPRLGFFGVIDERMDVELLDDVARRRPDWHFVIIGPVVKIDAAALPHRSNVHWLGKKTYDELPRYLAGWDVALMPFARNESTHFISPTKTPEYLAAGRPVVSTPIRDVVRPYGEQRLVRIADGPEEFIAACEAALAEDRGDREWLARVDAFLSGESWDGVWERMAAHERRAARADDQFFRSLPLPSNLPPNPSSDLN